MSGAPERYGGPGLSLALGVLGLAVVGLAMRDRHGRDRAAPDALRPRNPARHASRKPATGARKAAAILSGSVLLDSAMEHFRGEFHHPAMFAAPAAAAGVLAALGSPAGNATTTRTAVLTSAVATGAIGIAFHLHQLARRPGGFNFEGLFYGAPVGAPGALVLAGLAGLGADVAGRGGPGKGRGRAFALIAAGGLLATSAEIALLHFRGAFHDRAMYAPVILPPLAALALADAARDPSEARLRRTRALLRGTVALGLVGSAFHLRGMVRQMGGLHNWTQNLQVGPPLPAPPGLSGVALAGLAATDLLEDPR